MNAKLLSELAEAMHPTPFAGEDGLVRAAIDEIKRARKILFDERAAWVAIVNNLESGSGPPDPPKCPRCNGAGFVRDTTYYYECPLCHNPKRKPPSPPPPEPPKKVVYEWREVDDPEWKTRETILSLFRNSHAVGNIVITDEPIVYFVYPDFVELSAKRDTPRRYSASSIESAKAAVEAVARAHYGDEA